MSKHARVTGAAAVSELPPAPSPAGRVVAPGDLPQGKVGTADIKVVKWGNGAPADRTAVDETPPTAALDDKTATGGTEGATGGTPAKPAKEPKEAKAKDDETGTVSPVADAEGGEKTELTPPAKPNAAERRSSTLANLEVERRMREMENTLKALQPRAARADELEKALGGTLADKVKALNLSKGELDELTERLLTKDESLFAGAPDKPATPKVDPAVAELKETVKKLQERLEGRDQTEEQAAISRATATVAELVKEEDVPLVNADVPVKMNDGRVESGLSLTMQVAHQMWLDSGKNGNPQDYVKRAAANVETHLGKIYPGLTARQRAAAREEGGERTETAPSLGRRAGRGVVTSEPKLAKDTGERDQQIKKMFGWD